MEMVPSSHEEAIRMRAMERMEGQLDYFCHLHNVSESDDLQRLIQMVKNRIQLFNTQSTATIRDVLNDRTVTIPGDETGYIHYHIEMAAKEERNRMSDHITDLGVPSEVLKDEVNKTSRYEDFILGVIFATVIFVAVKILRRT